MIRYNRGMEMRQLRTVLFLLLLLTGATAQAQDQACLECHTEFKDAKVVHPALTMGCNSCHTGLHAGEKPAPKLTASVPDLCFGCHDKGAFENKYPHAPVADGMCGSCHNPHVSALPKLLLTPVPDLCFTCHDRNALAKKTVHASAAGGQCLVCHSAHGSPNKYQLVKAVPDLCFACHDKMQALISKVKVPHKPLLQEGGCCNCHSPHYARNKGLFSTDGNSVCLGCYDKDDLGTPRLRNIKKELAGKKYLHGPLLQGECKACHDPHGSDNFRILRGRYPAEIYAPYRDGIYEACLICHDKNLLRYPDTTIYTGFRNGNQNLHFLHVANKRKGRTCRVCHEPHASNGEKLISKEGSQFGEWRIPLNFRITPTGGSCAPGCHQAFSYDREKPVVYRSGN